MTDLPTPTRGTPIVVGPYMPGGREIWILSHDGTLTDRGGILASRSGFAQVVEVLRPAVLCGPLAAQNINWADRPDEWPQE